VRVFVPAFTRDYIQFGHSRISVLFVRHAALGVKVVQVGFEVLTAVSTKKAVFWVVVPVGW
jgi:hypothetical protein